MSEIEEPEIKAGSRITMNIQPLYDRVIIQPVEENEKSAGGIIIPETAAEKPMIGKVVAVGSGKLMDNGQLRPLTVKVGQKVLFGKYSGTEVKHNGQEYMVMREDDIMGIIS